MRQVCFQKVNKLLVVLSFLFNQNAVYTTLAPKSITGVRRQASSQLAPPRSEPDSTSAAEASRITNEDNSKAPPVQPPTSDQPTEPAAQQPMPGPSGYGAATADRSVSTPLTYSSAPNTPPSTSAGARRAPTSAAQRSISLSNGTHQNSPVMNETLSVIEEHITDMSTPRHSLLAPERGVNLAPNEEVADPVRRLSYINGHETDEEEEAGMLTEEDVRGWTPQRVAEYLEDTGAEPAQCEVFREQEISGDVLLSMDQTSLMLKEFELGSIGRRLALWQKVKALQEEVRIARAVPRLSNEHSPNEGTFDDSSRTRSTSMSTVLPRIPSLMESSSSRGQPRQQLGRAPSHKQPHQTESLSSLPTMANRERAVEHTRRPSAASVRSLNHSRRHSSIDYSAATQERTNTQQSRAAVPPSTSHTKKGSFDRTWTMGSTSQPPAKPSAESKAPQHENLELPNFDPDFASFPHEVGMTVVSSLDLDRGYFSGNEAENRKARNVLKKRNLEDPSHARAPSDSYSSRRLSGVFRHSRAGSTDSLVDSNNASLSATQAYYGTNHRSTSRATSGPQIGKSWRQASPSPPPTVTKLDYGHSPSIDAVAASPNIPGSETSSIDRPIPSPAAPGKTLFTRSRATGLRAISDAITGDEKASLVSPNLDKIPSPIKESPAQTPSRTGSSTPSMTSKSLEVDDPSLKNGTNSSGGQTPVIGASKRRGKKSTSAYLRGLEKKTPKEQLDGCDYSGWMKKKSSTLMTTWKTRLFVLRGRRLSYYYSEDDTEEKGLIDISFHRVLPANNDRITGLHAQVTGATSSPTSPHNSNIQTTASANAQNAPGLGKGDATGVFIFKLVPPRAGLSKAVNFTKPTVHYFAVDNINQGRLWMAALMKATIDRDFHGPQVVSTYKEKTISLKKAMEMRQRPPALMGDVDDKPTERGLAINYPSGTTENGLEKEGSLTTNGTADTASTENLEKSMLSTQGS
jgi:hypothetical protein